MLASKGEALPPCGVPSSLHNHCPSSSTPAFSWRCARDWFSTASIWVWQVSGYSQTICWAS